MKHWLSTVILIMGIVPPAAGQSSALNRVLAADVLGDPVVWLPDGIDNGMFAKRIAMAAQVPVVFEAALLSSPTAQRLERMALRGKSVREALDVLVATDPRYTWNEVAGVIVIRPLAAWGDVNDPLNKPVANVSWSNVSMSSALNGVTALLANGDAAAEPVDTTVDDRLFSVNVPSGSLIDVLIESARAHGGLVWFTPDTMQHPGHSGLSIGVANVSGRAVSADVPASR